MATALTKDKIKDEVFLQMLKDRKVIKARPGKSITDVLQKMWDKADEVATQALQVVSPE